MVVFPPCPLMLCSVVFALPIGIPVFSVPPLCRSRRCGLSVLGRASLRPVRPRLRACSGRPLLLVFALAPLAAVRAALLRYASLRPPSRPLARSLLGRIGRASLCCLASSLRFPTLGRRRAAAAAE